MKALHLASAVFLALLPQVALADLAAALSGKTLVLDKSWILMGADGQMSGKVGKSGKEDLAGTWEVKKGKLCRTIRAPDRLAGSECQTAVLDGNTLTLTRQDGSTIEWTVK